MFCQDQSHQHLVIVARWSRETNSPETRSFVRYYFAEQGDQILVTLCGQTHQYYSILFRTKWLTCFNNNTCTVSKQLSQTGHTCKELDLGGIPLHQIGRGGPRRIMIKYFFASVNSWIRWLDLGLDQYWHLINYNLIEEADGNTNKWTKIVLFELFNGQKT